jgi:hypothetical protein
MCGGCILKQRLLRQIAHCGSLPRVHRCVLNAMVRTTAVFWEHA